MTQTPAAAATGGSIPQTALFADRTPFDSKRTVTQTLVAAATRGSIPQSALFADVTPLAATMYTDPVFRDMLTRMRTYDMFRVYSYFD